ncbi:MAG: hypothetical protein RLZZ494_49 [Pseudomonadota bacterium]|jgi:uncharacterized protein YyaL (SSP411 family)
MPHRLAHHPSAFVRQQAQHPVDWHIWGSEALTRAQAENKPLLVFLGHTTSPASQHLAQVCFRQADTARHMNTGFVNVLVDRACRPDLDQLFQQAHEVLQPGSRVGWAPQMVFCSARGLPFHSFACPGGAKGWPWMGEVLSTVARLWCDQRDGLLAQARTVRQRLGEGAPEGSPLWHADTDVRAWMTQARLQWGAAYDAPHGGFGGWPRQAHPTVLAALLHEGQQGDEAAQRMALHSLRCMAQSPLFDAAAGGFFHACQAPAWQQPSPEKTLADNAMLAWVYAQAAQSDSDPLWPQVVEATVAFVLRDLQATLCEAHSPPLQGGFCTALATLGGTTLRDSHQSTALNALMLRALVAGARVCHRPAWHHLARETLRHLCQTRLTPEDRLLACAGEDGTLDDHAFLLEAVLDLHAADPQPGDMALACVLADALHERFEDPVEGGFFLASHDAPPLWHRLKPSADRILPSGNASAMAGLARLGRTQDRRSAQRVLEALRLQICMEPASHAALLQVAVSLYGVSPLGSAQSACPTGA